MVYEFYLWVFRCLGESVCDSLSGVWPIYSKCCALYPLAIGLVWAVVCHYPLKGALHLLLPQWYFLRFFLWRRGALDVPSLHFGSRFETFIIIIFQFPKKNHKYKFTCSYTPSQKVSKCPTYQKESETFVVPMRKWGYQQVVKWCEYKNVQL